MSTEISTQTQSRALTQPASDEVCFQSLVQMGDQLRKTGFLPAHIKDGVSFAAIVLMGRELGMGTMAACRKLQVIKGTVTERADSQLSRFKSCGGKSQFRELTEQKAVLWLRHPNGDEHLETFTIEDAKRAGLASNDNYAKHPKAMLRSRAITAGLKSIGWEGAVGIYDPDEIADETPEYREPVVVRPKFQSDTETVVPLKPKVSKEPQRTRADAGRLAIGSAATIEACEALRSKLDVYHDGGEISDDEFAELTKLLMGRVEILMTSVEEVTNA